MFPAKFPGSTISSLQEKMKSVINNKTENLFIFYSVLYADLKLKKLPG